MSHAYRRRNAQALYESHVGPNMTPMVDVVMVILIFFMASTAFLGPEWFLKSYLPRRTAAAAPTTEPTRLRLALTRAAEGGTSVTINDGPPMNLADLDRLLSAEASLRGPENLVVPVEAAPDVAYEDVVRVHEVCDRLGIRKVGLN